jgi:type IV secretion system protein VirD4
VVFFGELAKHFSKEHKLYKARYAYICELAGISIDKAHITNKVTAIFLAFGHYQQVFCAKPTKNQKEIANILLIGKTRVGKGLNIETNLLTWPYPTIVNDIKGELWSRTAGFREKGLDGKALKFDPRGYGNKFDPLQGLETDFDLRSAATTLLYRPNEGDSAIFTQRAITMLVQIFHAARLEGQRLLPFTYKMMNEGLFGVVTILEIISEKHNYYPNLATKFLDINYDKADFKDKFLLSSWGTLNARLNNILTKETVRCFTGSDFTGKDIITSGKHPISVFLCWPEKHLTSLSPLIELVWNSLIDGMIDYYDSVQGKGCTRSMVVLDEIFRTGLAKLPKYATTVCGRGMTLFVSAQSKSQFDAEYGKFKADELRGQFDTAIVHRPAPLDIETTKFMEEILGYTSGFAHSQNAHAGGMSTGENEQRIPLLPAYETELLADTQVIVKRSGIRAAIAERLDWRQIPELRQRANMKLPQLPILQEADTSVPWLTTRSRAGRGQFSPHPVFLSANQSTPRVD